MTDEEAPSLQRLYDRYVVFTLPYVLPAVEAPDARNLLFTAVKRIEEPELALLARRFLVAAGMPAGQVSGEYDRHFGVAASDESAQPAFHDHDTHAASTLSRAASDGARAKTRRP